MRFFKRRLSDPNPQLVNLSLLTEPEFFNNSATASKDSVFQNFEKLSIDNNGKIDSNNFEPKEISNSQLRSIYEKYKDLSSRIKSKSHKASSPTIELNEQQLLDYLKIINPSNHQEHFLDSLFTNVSDENLSKKSSKITRLKSFKSIFSRSCKSDDEDDYKCPKKTSSTGSLTSLTNFIFHKKEKRKVPESGYGSDSPRGSIKSQQIDHEDSYYNADTDTADEDDTLKPNYAKRPKDYDDTSTISKLQRNFKLNSNNKDANLKHITLKVGVNEKIGIEVNPSVTFVSGITGTYFITEIIPGSPTDRQGYLRKGDELIEVNNHKLKGLPISVVNNILRTTKGNVKILSRRSNTIKFTPFNAKLKAKRTIKQEENSKFYDDNRSTISEISTNKKVLNRPKRKHSSISRSSCSSIGESETKKLKIIFRKGVGCKSLGFTVVGGRDSPRGTMGIYIKRILPEGQAADSNLQEGDQILSVNQLPLQGLSHIEAVSLFKSIKTGDVIIDVIRKKRPVKFKSPL